MRKMKRCFAVLLAALLLLTGCGNTETTKEEEKAISVIAILKAQNSLHWHFVNEGLRQTAKKYNIQLNVLWPEREVDVETQVRMIRDAVQAAPDVIIWAPDDSENAAVYAGEIQDAGIELIYVDENAQEQSDVPYVGSDNYHAGELAATSLIRVLESGDEVAFIGGSQEQQVHILRKQGFQDTIENNGKLQFMEVEEVPDCSIAGGKAAMKRILQNHPNINGVFCASALLCMGAQEACQGRDPKIMVVGMDTQSDVLTALKNGRIHAVISQSGYEMGCSAIELAVKKMNGETVPVMNYVHNDIISKENVTEYVDAFVMEGRE